MSTRACSKPNCSSLERETKSDIMCFDCWLIHFELPATIKSPHLLQTGEKAELIFTHLTLLPVEGGRLSVMQFMETGTAPHSYYLLYRRARLNTDCNCRLSW